MSADDTYYMDLFGFALVQFSVSVVCESIFWTMYLILFCFAMRIQLYAAFPPGFSSLRPELTEQWLCRRRGLRTVPTISMFVVTWVLFLSSTSLWITNVATFFGRMNIFFRTHPELGLLDRILASNDYVEPFGLPEEALFLVNVS